MCPIIFIFWLVFFEWTETEYSNHCAGLLTLPCIQVLHHWCTYNSHNENNSWFNRWFDFYKSEEPPLLSMQKGRKQAIFILYARRYSSIWISNVILRVPIECWHIQIIAGYLSMSQKLSQVSRKSSQVSQKSSQVSRVLLVSWNYLRAKWIFFLKGRKLMYAK